MQICHLSEIFDHSTVITMFGLTSTTLLTLSLCIFFATMNIVNFFTVHMKTHIEVETFDVDFSGRGDGVELHTDEYQGQTAADKTYRQTARQEQGQEQLLQQNSTRPERFAYAYLIAGCDPQKPSYLGYVYNIIVSKRILLERGSKADVVVMVRMRSETEATTLPSEHEQMFAKSGVIVKYIPKAHVDNFHTAMIDKFRILNLMEYTRILYLDADAIGLYNLDYMFHLSTGPGAKLEENVILAYRTEPANGGFFMLKPDEQDYNKLMSIVKETEKSGYDFNETLGFGHVITPPDFWESYSGEKGTKWDWHGAYTDQGSLLIHV